MKTLLFALILVTACAPVATTPPSTSPSGSVHFTAERVSDTGVRLALDNGASNPIGYNLCTSSLERRTTSGWTPVATNELCTMQLMTLNPGADATFNKTLPANLGHGEYRYVTAVENPLGTASTRIATNSFSM